MKKALLNCDYLTNGRVLTTEDLIRFLNDRYDTFNVCCLGDMRSVITDPPISDSDRYFIETHTPISIRLKFHSKESNLSHNIETCEHLNKYKNVVSKSLQFWFCPDCKKDLGDI